MPAWDLVIFDNDGVLVDSEPLACRIEAELLTGYGLPITADEVMDQYRGGSIGQSRTQAERALGRPLPADFEAEYAERVFAAFRHELQASPGAAATVARLQAEGQPFCVASSGSHERIRLALDLTGLRAAFEGRIFSAEDVARGKPAPDLFLLAAARLGARPAGCAVVEDSAPGLAAARAAGMRSIAYTPPGGPPLEHAGADATITHLTALPATLEALARHRPGPNPPS